MRRARAARWAVLATGLAAAGLASAQRLDPRRPKTLVVGPPQGASPMHRVDAQRTGLSKAPLPSGTLRIAWKKTTAQAFDQPALSASDGSLALVSVRGDVTFLDEAGEESSTLRGGAQQAGPAVLTSDGTVVYTTGGGEAVGVQRGRQQPRFVTRIGGDRNERRTAPLALNDGGVVVTTTTDLVALDAEGNVRSRTSLPEPPATPLLVSGDRVVAITTSGAVFGWAPGREAVRLGSFGAPVDGGAAIGLNGALVAVIEGNHLAEVDLARGGRSTRAIAGQGLYLGPPAVRGPLVTLLALTQTRGFVVTLDGAGQELVRAPIATFNPAPLVDGGAPPLVAPPHVGVLVDARGAIAFAATDGAVGVVGPDGAVDTLGEMICAKASRSGVVGLTPSGSGAFVVMCESGTVARITGLAEARPKPAAPVSSETTKLRPSPPER